MRICDVTQFYSPRSGGVRRYLHTKIDYIRDRTDHEHVLIVPGPRDRRTENSRTLEIQVASPPLPFSQSYRVLARVKRVLEAIRSEKPDLVEIGDSYQLARMLPAPVRERGIPCVAFYHSDYPRSFDRFVRQLFGMRLGRMSADVIGRYVRDTYARFDATLVASRRMIGILRGIGLDRLCLCPLGTDIDLFRPGDTSSAVRARLGISSGAALLLFVGRFSHEKYLDVLLAAVKALNARGDRTYHLVLVGDGPLRGRIQREQETRTDVTWVPYVADRGTLAEYYSAADLLVHPSISETYGLCILEAAACGTPSVTVRDGGADEVNFLGDEFVAARSTPGDLADTVTRALARVTPVLRESLRSHVERNYSHNRCFERQFRLYEEVCRHPHQAGQSPLSVGEDIPCGISIHDPQVRP